MSDQPFSALRSLAQSALAHSSDPKEARAFMLDHLARNPETRNSAVDYCIACTCSHVLAEERQAQFKASLKASGYGLSPRADRTQQAAQALSDAHGADLWLVRCIGDTPLKLATKHQLSVAALSERTTSTTSGVNARWYERIAKALPGDESVVSAHLTLSTIVKWYQESQNPPRGHSASARKGHTTSAVAAAI